MKMHLKGLIAITALILIAGCETTSTRPYQPSTQNIMAAQKTLEGQNVKLSVGNFSTAAGVDASLTCRAMGKLDVLPGKTPVDYIRQAFETELFQAGALSSSGTQIRGTIEKLEFSSMGTGNWSIALRVSSENLQEGYTSSVSYDFKTSYSAVRACQNVVDAFQPAVSELLGEVVADSRFAKLAGN